MKQFLIQLDDRLADQLEQIAPGKSRKRSEFLRKVIARALQDELEQRTREAYQKWPDEPPPFDPSTWAPESEAVHPPTRPAKRQRASARAKR